MAGRFITLEGGEGSGKSTQAERLKVALEKRGIEALVTREPGGAPGAEAIRALLLGSADVAWDPHTEALLHFGARREHVTHTIRPALARGRWVISDRFADSTMAYQGYAQGLGRQAITELQRLVLGDFAPDLTLILDVPVAAGLARESNRDRYGRMGQTFHEIVRAAFLDIAAREPARCAVIDATQDVATVANAILRTVEQRLLRR